MSHTEQVEKLIKSLKDHAFAEMWNHNTAFAEDLNAAATLIEKQHAELERWHTDVINDNIKNVFANTSTYCCANCTHKDEYIEELEYEIAQLKEKKD